MINEEITKCILEYLLKEYLSKNIDPFIDIVSYLEDKLIFLYLNNFSKKHSELKKIEKNNKKRKSSGSLTEEDNEDEKASSFTICKGMHKFNSILKKMIKNNEIAIDEEIYEKFKSYFDKINNSLQNKYDSGDKKEKIMFYSILKIIILTLVLFLKNPKEFEDTLFDLSNLLDKLANLSSNKQNGSNKKNSNKKDKKQDNNDPMFEQVFTEICLQLNSYGSQTLIEFIMRTFKKVSPFLGLESLNVLKSYVLNSEINDSNNDDVMNGEKDEDQIIKSKMNVKKQKAMK